MRRMPAALVLVSLTAACGGGSVLSTPAPAGPVDATITAAPRETAPTAAPGTTATTSSTSSTITTSAATSAATTSVTTLPAPGLDVLQVLVRYDGTTGTGNLEATVCNLGEAAEPEVRVAIASGGAEAVVSGVTIPPRACRGFYDPAYDLAAFGAAGPGELEVTVTAAPSGGAAIVETHAVAVAELDAAAPADEIGRYRDCRNRGQDHRNCVGEVPYHPIGDAGEIMKVRGRVLAIGPGEFGDLLSFFVADDSICSERVEGWTTLAGPGRIAHRMVATDDFAGGYTSHYLEMYSLASHDDWVQSLAAVDTWWPGVLDGLCNNAHEMTHLVLGDTPMPSWIEEGLATYMEADARSGSGRAPAVECREESWYGWRFEGGEGEMPYQDLTTWDRDVPAIYYYYTAMCFWDHLAAQYGDGPVREILRTTASYRDPGFNGCSDLVGSVLFMRDIVAPVLGEDITTLTEARWGFGEGLTGCEG